MRPSSPSKRTAAQPPPATTSFLYNIAVIAAPPPYTLLPPNPHALPLRYPIAYWSAPPQHHIAAIGASSPHLSAGGSRYVYTASVEGHIVQWEPLASKQPQQPTAASPTASSAALPPPSPSPSSMFTFRPRFLSFRHGSASITALCCVPYMSSFLVCAATSEGFLSVWSSSGQCLASSFALPFHATALLPLHSLPSYMSSSSYVMAVSSHSPYLYLYSLPSVHPVLLLGHEADGSGIVGLCTIPKRARSRPGEEKDGSSQPTSGSSTPTGSSSSAVEEREMVCSVSASGLITVWDIHNKLKKQRDKRAAFPFFSFSTFQSSVLSSSPSASLAPLSIISATAAFCLVLTNTSVAVVSMLSLSVLSLVSLADRDWGVGDGAELISLECGSVLQSDDESVLQLVLTTNSRIVLIVRLACRYERRRRKDGKLDERCDCNASLDAIIPLDKHTRNSPSSFLANPASTTAAGVLLPASTASCVRVVDEHVLVGHVGGEVTVYGLPSVRAVSQSSPAVLLPSFYSCLAFAFPHLSLASLLSPAVTCSHLFLSSSPPFLYHCAGHADGRLHVSSLTSSSDASDIDFSVPAHSSAICCMLDVEVRGAAGCQRLLATGGDDGSVCLWNVEEGRCRARFYASTAVVALMQLSSMSQLSVPPPASESLAAFAFPVTSSAAAASWTLPCLLFVVCACNTIKVYSLSDFSLVSSLPSHSSPPVCLSLYSTSSDLLLVLTACGSLYLWSMSAGQLLGVVEAQPGRTGEEKGGFDYWMQQRGGGRTADVGMSELAMACAQARLELKGKREAEQDSKRANGRRGSTVNVATTASAFASLSSSPFLLSALSALSSSSPLTLPSLTAFPLSPSLRTQQTELVQLLSLLFPSAPLQALEKEKREVHAEADEEEKESNQRRREREKEREEERVETARERAKAIERDRASDEQRTQLEAEEVEERRKDAAGLVSPPVLDVLNWASCSFNSPSAVSSCVSVAVLNVPALLEQLQASYPHSVDEYQDGKSTSFFTFLQSFLSLLFDWDGKGNVESLLRDQLHLPPPRPTRSFAQLSCDDSAVTALFPSHAYSYRRWQVGEEWSALHALSVSSLCMALLSPSASTPASPPPTTTTVSKLLSYYTTTLIDSPKHYPPSLTQLLSYTLHSSPLVSTTSRLLLQQYLTRLPLHAASALSTAWAEYFDYPLSMDGIWGDWDEKGAATDGGRDYDDTAVSEQELLVAQLLTMIGVRELEEKKRKRRQQQLLSDSDQFVPFSPLASSGASAPLTEFEAKSQYITHTLLRVIARPLTTSTAPASLHQQRMTTLACDLLCSALSFLRIHISAPLPLLRHLLLLSVSSVSSTVASSSTRLLMECGRLAPSFFIECMGREALNSLSPQTLRQSSISSLSTLLRTHPLPLSRSLPSSVHTIIRCLDPASPQLRKTMLNVATAALYALVTLYPACSFHQQSQRFAVGCWGKDGSGGLILVYDLRTATVWRVMEGHSSDVHAVLFSRDEAGDRLVSYSVTEGSGVLRVWNTEVGGWLGGLIGMSGKCVRTVKLERVDVKSLLKRERDVAREKARMAVEEERREEKRREEKGLRKRATPRHLNVQQSTLVVNGQDLLTSSPHSFFSSNSPSSSPSIRRLATDSPTSTSVTFDAPAAATRTPPAGSSTSSRLPPPPTLHPNSSSSSSSSSTASNGRVPPSPSPSPLSSAAAVNSIPPPLQLSAGDDDEAEEEVEGMGPSIGIATYHALPGAVLSGGGVAGSGSDRGSAVTGAMQRRLLCVKLSWLNDKVVRVVREDGSVRDVQV